MVETCEDGKVVLTFSYNGKPTPEQVWSYLQAGFTVRIVNSITLSIDWS